MHYGNATFSSVHLKAPLHRDRKESSICRNSPAWQLKTHADFVVLTQEIQTDLVGPIFNEKEEVTKKLAIVDSFLKYKSAEVVVKTKGPNVVQFIEKYNETPAKGQRGIDRAERLC